MLIKCGHDSVMPIEGLLPHPKNSNKHPKKQIERLAKILKYQGWCSPINVSNLSGHIVSGHGRVAAAKLNEWKEVPVKFIDFESDEQEIAYLISDNAIAEWAELDLSMINTQIGDLGPDFDLDLLGLDGFEIDVADRDVGCDEDEVPEPKEPVLKPGDLIEMGNHRLLCGDSTNIQHVEKLMDGEKAQTFFTDPPYGDNVGGLRTKTGEERKKAIVEGKTLIKQDVTIKNDEKIDWLRDVFNLVPSFLTKESTKMVFFKWDKYQQIKDYAECFGEPSACCVWDKDRKASTFFRFQPQHEFCFHWGNQSDKKTTSSMSNVWRIQKELENNSLHPTVKPIALIEPVIEVTTDKRGSVIDLFGGSGSTLIACEKTNRKCYMMELDPHYCDVIVSRYAKYSGNRNIKINGEMTDWTS